LSLDNFFLKKIKTIVGCKNKKYKFVAPEFISIKVMSKRRSIISYDKLTIEQKKQILKEFPDGYINHLTTIKTPTGEILDALIWDTEEVIYLVKINKIKPKIKPVADDDEEEFEEDFDKASDIKEDDLDADSDDDDDDYDKPEEDAGEEDED
jgi:hypothetical protein